MLGVDGTGKPLRINQKSPRYPIPTQRVRSEIEVERSRFIATLQEVGSVKVAQAFIAEIKAEFSNANHNCWAYLIGPAGSSDRIGLSDDGEPHGVAGRPLLTCLQHSGVGDIAVVVTRYFGGVKLGKGGMVKAYTAAVQSALDRLPVTERIDWCELLVTFDYPLVSALERGLVDFEAERLTTQYAEKVSFHLRLPVEKVQEFRRFFEDLSAGQGRLRLHTSR